MRLRLLSIAACLIALTVTGCTQQEEQSSSRFLDKPLTCGLSNNAEQENDPAHLPSTLSAECVWDAEGEYIGTAHGVSVTLFRPRSVVGQSGNEWYQLRGYDINTGELLWRSEKLTYLRPLEAEILHNTGSDASYVAVFDRESGSRRRGASPQEKHDQLTISFYPVNNSGTAEPRTYTAPPGYVHMRSSHWLGKAAHANMAPGRVLLAPQGTGAHDHVDKYVVVDPVTARSEILTPPQKRSGELSAEWRYSRSSLPYTPYTAVLSNGGSVTNTRLWNPHWVEGQVHEVRDKSGAIQWDTLQSAPQKAMKGLSVFSGVYKNYAVFWWYKGKWESSPPQLEDTTSTALVSLHNLSTGEVLAVGRSRVEGRLSSTDVPALRVSADERFLASRNVIFDLRESTVHAELHSALEITALNSTHAYAFDHREGTRTRPLHTAIEIDTQKVVWQATTGYMPVAVTHRTALMVRDSSTRPRITAFPVA